jgi:hypothetical protein
LGPVTTVNPCSSGIVIDPPNDLKWLSSTWLM